MHLQVHVDLGAHSRAPVTSRLEACKLIGPLLCKGPDTLYSNYLEQGPLVPVINLTALGRGLRPLEGPRPISLCSPSGGPAGLYTILGVKLCSTGGLGGVPPVILPHGGSGGLAPR